MNKEKGKELEKRRIIEARKNAIAVDVIMFNKDIKRLKDTLEKEIAKMDDFKSKFANQRLISSKIELLKRVLVGTRYGLDRQTVRLYDIDELPLRDNE